MNKDQRKGSLSLGFSLLEVLIALVILSIAFISIYSATSANTRTLALIEKKTAANWIALNIITEAQLGLIDLEQMENAPINTEKMFNQEWYWFSSLTEEQKTGIYRVDVKIKETLKASPLLHLVGYLRTIK